MKNSKSLKISRLSKFTKTFSMEEVAEILAEQLPFLASVDLDESCIVYLDDPESSLNEVYGITLRGVIDEEA